MRRMRKRQMKRREKEEKKFITSHNFNSCTTTNQLCLEYQDEGRAEREVEEEEEEEEEDKGWISFGVRIFSIVVVPGETMRTRK
jgi:hypothetical protein